MGAARTSNGASGQGGHPLAQLHRRVRELRDRGVVALALLLVLSSALPGQASAQTDFVALERALASDVARERAAAIAGYDALTASDVDAMSERMDQLRRPAIDTDEVTRIVSAFRHAVGSRRADDLVDIAPGIAIVLENEHERPTVRVAEAILIERAGERIDTRDSLALVPALMRFGGEGMRLEGRRITMRLDARLAATAIACVSSGDHETRLWATWTAERFGTAEPGRFVRTLDPELVPDMLRAYAGAHVMSAVSIAASFVDSDHRALRDAAREALTTYGQSSIWVARQTYRQHASEDASRDYGWRRTLDELFAILDHERDAIAEPYLARAETALEAGDRAAARVALDAALAAIPMATTTRAGAIALRLAELDLEAGDASAARHSLSRAQRLPSSEHDADRRDALALLLRADAMLAHGTLDADLYRRAATLDPTCERCVSTAETLAPPLAVASARSTLPLWLAALAFLVVSVLLWPTATKDEPPEAAPADASLGDA